MKKALVTILQLVAFLVVFFAFSLFPPFHLQHVLQAAPGSTRIFVADGLVLMLALYLVILFAEALLKRLPAAAPWTSLAFGLALILGFLMKFGLLTRSTY